MSSEPIISLRNVSKTYRAYQHPLHGLVSRVTGGKFGRHKEFHALNDISLDIHKGETVGIIGRNGSGKSTLLQIICGIRKPTSGSVDVKGRISALLELGSGFQPEFTGRENVFLQGAIMGLTREEMETRYEDIATFADIGEYIQQPVKTYSSGMLVRLAFAVAKNLSPEILVVDEALAVGDEAFQRKCYAHFRKFTETGGSLLFVSHSINTIVDLCNRTLLLDSGKLRIDSDPKIAANWYQKLLYTPQAKQQDVLDEISKAPAQVPSTIQEQTNIIQMAASFDPSLLSNSALVYQSQGATIDQPTIYTLKGENVNVLITGQEYVLSYQVTFHAHSENVLFGMMIKNLTGVQLGGINNSTEKPITPGTVTQVKLPFKCRLCQGTYFLNVGVFGSANGHATYLHRIVDALMFRVEGSSKYASGYLDFSVADVADVPAY